MDPQGCTICGVPHSSLQPHVRQVPVEMPGYLQSGETGWIVDTPENRALLEDAAIPGCKPWREAHPEYPPVAAAVTWLNYHAWCEANEPTPAPYCCSAYCDRCAGLRALNGVPPLLPNDWMRQ